MRLKQASNLFIVSSQLIQQQAELLDQRQHQARFGPCRDSIRLQRGLMELLPYPLADAGQASMLCLLEDQGNRLQGSLRCGLGRRKRLEER